MIRSAETLRLQLSGVRELFQSCEPGYLVENRPRRKGFRLQSFFSLVDKRYLGLDLVFEELARSTAQFRNVGGDCLANVELDYSLFWFE